MKTYIILFIILTQFSFSQFKNNGFSGANIKDGILNNSSNSIFSFLNNENFLMTHSINMSYSSFAGHGIAISTYTNSMMFKFSDKLNFQIDASIVNSPYSTLGREFQNNINGLYINRAALNYRPWKDFFISIQYKSYPFGLNRGYFNPYYNNYFYEY